MSEDVEISRIAYRIFMNLPMRSTNIMILGKGRSWRNYEILVIKDETDERDLMYKIVLAPQNKKVATHAVVNISGSELSTSEISVLSKGLSFCPKPPRIESFQLRQDLARFIRRLRLKEYFFCEDDNDNEYSPFRKRSHWTPPPNRNMALETYIKALMKDFEKELHQRPKKFYRDNLTKDEREALFSLKTRTDIVIKRADKGSATVVMSRENYVREVMRQLDNEQHYLKLSEDPTDRFAEEIKMTLEEMVSNGGLDKETMKCLLPEEIRTSRFYILPKIHKPGNPGRPIVSSCGAPTEQISRFVDYHLAPLVNTLPSYIKDTTDFLVKLQNLPPLPPGTLLVTLDVKSLYTNIPHEEGLEACRAALNTRAIQQPPTEDLVRLVELILTKNNFTFDQEHYLQLHGTAMGTRMAPSYANIFMGHLEERLLNHVDNKPDVWWRYIDDVFMVWPFGEGCLNDFLEQINHFHPTIKFTAEWSNSSISFLDVRVLLNQGRITTDLFQKPTDTHQYLHQNSCHPKHCKSSIPYSQALRLRRICSDDETFYERTKELKHHLVKRGYRESAIQQQIGRASSVNRNIALTSSERDNTHRVPLVVTYHPELPNLSKILRDHLPTLHVSEKMKKAVPNAPLVAYRRPRSLNDLLVRASIRPLENVIYEGSRQCGRPRCKTCAHVKTGTEFTSAVTGVNFNARVTANCRTSNIVYLIQCRKCKMQYVGETENPLHLRMNGHRSDYYRKLPDKPVAKHFYDTPGHTFEDVSVMIIEQLRSGGRTRRKDREGYWIYTLRTLTPDGLNLELSIIP